MPASFPSRLFTALCLAACLAGCIKEDFSGCPPVPPHPAPDEGEVELRVTYRKHLQREGEGYADLFYENMRWLAFYIFDEEGNCATWEEIESGENGFLPEGVAYLEFFWPLYLKEGRYQAVVLGNCYDDEMEVDGGKHRPFSESRLRLRAMEAGETGLLKHNLFYGATDSCFEVRAGEKLKVPIDLMKDRNDIRVLVRWQDKERHFCRQKSHLAGFEARLVGRNGVMDFGNRPLRDDSVVYLPGHLRPEAYHDSLFYGAGKHPEEGEVYKADFSTLRLMTDGEERLRLYQEDSLVYDCLLVDILKKVEAYRSQEMLDRQDHYLIELFFSCTHFVDPDKPVDPEEPTDPDNPPVDPDNPPVDPAGGRIGPCSASRSMDGIS